MLGVRSFLVSATCTCVATFCGADTRDVYLQTNAGAEIQIATVKMGTQGRYTVVMDEAAFSDHFLSMRPFRCIAGDEKHWCHLPYPYAIKRNVSNDLVDLEYDFLFVWKGARDYGINLWNGVYYKLGWENEQLVGVLHEVDLDQLGIPPEAENLRPITSKDLHPADPASHWLPRLVIK